jgi:multiple sugar transport system ATP-binding protein
MVFQNYALYPHMTVRENMRFGLEVRNMPRKEIEQRTLEAAEILGVSEYLDRKPRQLSGGQRRRVAPSDLLYGRQADPACRGWGDLRRR